MTDKSTQPRLDARKVSPDLYKAMAGLQNYIDASGLDRKVTMVPLKDGIAMLRPDSWPQATTVGYVEEEA